MVNVVKLLKVLITPIRYKVYIHKNVDGQNIVCVFWAVNILSVDELL